MYQEINPRKQFLALEADAKAFRALVVTDAFKRAMTHCLAELALHDLTPDQLKGARTFASMFSNFGEEGKTKAFPTRRLDHKLKADASVQNPEKS